MADKKKELADEMPEESLEELFAKLDQVAKELESGDTSLEESFGLYQKGMEMLKLCNEKIDIYVAKNLIPSHQHLDEDEFINVGAYTIDELRKKIYSGEIEDSKTVAALLAYADKYKK